MDATATRTKAANALHRAYTQAAHVGGPEHGHRVMGLTALTLVESWAVMADPADVTRDTVLAVLEAVRMGREDAIDQANTDALAELRARVAQGVPA